MKLLCVADHKDPLVYSAELKNRYRYVDMVLGAGDLDLDYYGYIVSVLNRPLLFVFGNHNLKNIHKYRREYAHVRFDHIPLNMMPKTYGSTYVGRKVKNVNGLIVAGLGGSRRYNNGINQFHEYQMFFQMLRLVPAMLFHRVVHGRWLDILLTHAPPLGIHDKDDACHKGFSTFLLFMRWFKPRFLVHGHVHLYDRNEQRRTRYRNTMVVNAYDHVIIDTEAADG